MTVLLEVMGFDLWVFFGHGIEPDGSGAARHLVFPLLPEIEMISFDRMIASMLPNDFRLSEPGCWAAAGSPVRLALRWAEFIASCCTISTSAFDLKLD